MPVAHDLLYQRIGYIVGDTLKRFIPFWVLLRTGRLLCSRVAESCPAGLIPHSTWSGTLKHGVGPARPNRCGKKIPQRQIWRRATVYPEGGEAFMPGESCGSPRPVDNIIRRKPSSAKKGSRNPDGRHVKPAWPIVGQMSRSDDNEERTSRVVERMDGDHGLRANPIPGSSIACRLVCPMRPGRRAWACGR